MNRMAFSGLFLVCLVSAACGDRPSPVSPSAVAVASPAPAPVAAPVYVTVGDSLARGAYILTLEATIPGTWIHTEQGSTTITKDWQRGGAGYESMKQKIGTARPTVVLIHLGANDVVSSPPPTEENITAALERLLTALKTDYPGVTIYLSDVGQVWTYGDKRIETATVRRSIETAWTWAQVKPGPMLRDLVPDDGVHYSGDENTRIIAERWAAALKQ